MARYDQACHPAPDAGSSVGQTSRFFAGTLVGIPGYRVVAQYDENVTVQNATGSTGGERCISRKVMVYFVFLRKSITFALFARGASRHITT